jgi:mitogen-activated protein kinase 1/3
MQRYLRQLKPKTGTGIDRVYPGAEPEAIRLLKDMLHMNPRKRITVEQVR